MEIWDETDEGTSFLLAQILTTQQIILVKVVDFLNLKE